MPTITEACRTLNVSRHTLGKFREKLGIERVKNDLDGRFWELTDEQVEQIRALLARRPGQQVPPNAPGWPTVPRAIPSPVEVPPPARPPLDHYRPSQGHPAAISASQEDLARRPLPPGWIARSTWSRRHGLNDRSVMRSGRMPIAEAAPNGEPWGSFVPASHIYQAIYAAFREDQLEECAQVARSAWAHRWHPCEDSMCPCKG